MVSSSRSMVSLSSVAPTVMEVRRSPCREAVVVRAVVASGNVDHNPCFHGFVEDAAVHVLAV